MPGTVPYKHLTTCNCLEFNNPRLSDLQDQTDGSGGSSSSTSSLQHNTTSNSKPLRRALGELTNSPRLLSPTTPTKQVRGPPPSPAITPTHNLKLLTELAAKVAANGGPGGGGSGGARQTLQFEDFDQERYAR